MTRHIRNADRFNTAYNKVDKMSLNTSPLSGSKSTLSSLPKLTKLGGGLSKSGSTLPKLGSSGLKSLTLPKKKDAPAEANSENKAIKPEETTVAEKAAPPAEETKSNAAENATSSEESSAQSEAKSTEHAAEEEDTAGSSISMLMPDISAFLAADEGDEDEKTTVQSTDEFLGHLLGGTAADEDWSLDDIAKTSKVPMGMSVPSTPAASEIPKMPEVPSVNVDTSSTGVSSIKLTTPSVEMPAAPVVAPITVSVPTPVTTTAPDAPSLSDIPAPPAAQPQSEAEPPSAPAAEPEKADAAPDTPAAPTVPPAPQMTPEEEMLALMTPEERKAYEEEKMLEQMTPEERKAYEEQMMLEQMTPEEQEAYILEQMTPEEREAYQAEKAKAMADDEIKKQKRRQEMYENYQLDQQNAPKKSNAMPIIIVVLILVAIGAFAGIYFKGEADNAEREAAAAQAKAEAEAAAAATPQKTVSDFKLDWYNVHVDCPEGAILYVNGVETDAKSPVRFVKGFSNTVIAYLDGMVPFFKTFTKDDEIPETIKVEFESDELYMKTTVEFKFEDASIKGNDLKVTYDGRTLSSMPNELQDVVMGRPHTLILDKPGAAKHLHIFWPTKMKGSTKARVTLPALETINNAQSGTTLNTKPFPKSTEPYGIRIRMGETTWQTETEINAPHDAFIEYAITRKQRVPLNLGLYPDTYGTVNLDTDLLQDPLGEALVSFKVPKGAKKDALDNLQICFRREGVCICPDMKTETAIPSGPDWRVIAYVTKGGTKDILRNEYSQELKSKRGYIFSPKVNNGSLILDTPEWRVVEDAKNQDKKDKK